MLDDKMRAELDQAQAMLGESLPPLWWRLYTNSVVAGFTELQAFELVRTFILSDPFNKK